LDAFWQIPPRKIIGRCEESSSECCCNLGGKAEICPCVGCFNQDYVSTLPRCLSVLLGQAGQEIHWVVNQLETQALRLAAGFLVSQANEHEAGWARGGQVSVAARRSWRGTAENFLIPRTPCRGGSLGPSKIALSRLALPPGNGSDIGWLRRNMSAAMFCTLPNDIFSKRNALSMGPVYAKFK